MKLRSIKGFSLIEMLIVISIIAVLVSIIIPSVNYSSNRAAAATNAANLRAMYGKLNVMKLQNPEDFETLLSGGHHNGITIGDGSPFGTLLQELAVKRFATFTASGGTIGLPSGVVLDALPSAKVVSYKGGYNSNSVQIPEGTEMTIVITDEHILTFYSYYTIENFADIAEDGKLDGSVSSGIVKDFFGGWCENYGRHFYGSGTWWDPHSDSCKLCGYTP